MTGHSIGDLPAAATPPSTPPTMAATLLLELPALLLAAATVPVAAPGCGDEAGFGEGISSGGEEHGGRALRGKELPWILSCIYWGVAGTCSLTSWWSALLALATRHKCSRTAVTRLPTQVVISGLHKDGRRVRANQCEDASLAIPCGKGAAQPVKVE